MARDRLDLREFKNQMRPLRIKEFCQLMRVSKDWAYSEIRNGRLPLVTFCGEPVRPWLIDVEKVQGLFSSANANVIPITEARSLKTKKPAETVGHNPVRKEDLWLD